MALKSVASEIVAFEPQPEVYSVMIENIKMLLAMLGLTL